jgi:hypothetical protein
MIKKNKYKESLSIQGKNMIKQNRQQIEFKVILKNLKNKRKCYKLKLIKFNQHLQEIKR